MTVCAVAVPKNAAQATSVDSKLGILSEGRGEGVRVRCRETKRNQLGSSGVILRWRSLKTESKQRAVSVSVSQDSFVSASDFCRNQSAGKERFNLLVFAEV
jgi:hypothetical protein